MTIFRIVIRKTEFYLTGDNRRGAGVYYGPQAEYASTKFQGTLAQALQARAELSAEFNWCDHAAILSMEYPNDRKPNGFSKIKNLYNSLEWPDHPQL